MTEKDKFLGYDSNSSSEEDSSNFGVNIKRVEMDQELPDSDSPSRPQGKEKNKRRNYSKRITSLLDVSEDGQDLNKSKFIKKNCISAKKSRQRKKIYIETLEQKAEHLKQEILKRKDQIAANRDAILSLLRQTNPEKCRFIELKIKESKLLANELNKILKEQKQRQASGIKNEEMAPAPAPENHLHVQYMIDSFLYKFGFNGVLRKDVIEQLKMKWFQLAIDEKIISNGYGEELKQILGRFKQCIEDLAAKNNDLQFLLRNLQEKLDTKDVITLLLKPEFLKTHSEKEEKIEEEMEGEGLSEFE